MTLDYFYGAQADQFAFYRIPKALFTDERFKSISAEAKILYGILLDRMSLSRKNGWLDEQGRVFIIFTLEEVMEAFGCADQKATKLLNELDSKAGLIERKRQGLGKPNLIFVKNFVDNSTGSIPPTPESRIKTRENHDSADVNFTTPESRKSRGSNTDSNYTDLSETETYPFPSGQGGGHGQAPVDKMGRDMDEREQYRAILEDNLEYDILLENNPYDRDTIAEIMELLLDTICSKRQYIRIAGDDKPREVVKSQFLKLNCTHIEYVLSSFKENASKVRNIMTTNLVVADISRTEKTICLAVSPALKAYGIPVRARLFEVVERVKEVNAERRREESAIVIKATDRYSETVKRKGETTKSFGKNLGKTEDILTLLSKNKATIRVDVKQAKAPCRMRKSSLRKPAAKRTS